MIIDVIKFKGHGSFSEHFAGFDRIKPINVIIGRNNSGKSHLIDFVEQMCSTNPMGVGWIADCSGILVGPEVKRVFPINTTGGHLPGDHWAQTGRYLVDARVEWTLLKHNEAKLLRLPEIRQITGRSKDCQDAMSRNLEKCVVNAKTSMHGKKFLRLRSERDVVPEKPSPDFRLRENGSYATNIIRRCLRSSSPPFSAELIRTSLLQGLNIIFGEDGEFQEIEVKEHDQSDDVVTEIYLTEMTKGSVPLSKSGSGIKTVLLVLLNLLVVPSLSRLKPEEIVFAFEELENNLHPAVLRRLFKYIESFAVEHNTTVFLTTHSNVALDAFGSSENAQIVRVIHDGKSARTETVSDYFSHHHIISELGAKPSDMLQANGVIWVEGPSDRVYVNRWIELCSEGKVREGRDYQCAFFGGSLLGRAQFAEPAAADDEFANLLRLNPNVFVLCDSDRTAKSGDGSQLKDRVTRVISEVEKIPNAKCWITSGKEIENYLPGSVLGQVFDKPSLTDPKQFEYFFPSETRRKGSYIESKIGRKCADKVELALKSVRHMTFESMSPRFDWKDQMQTLMACIAVWNK